MTISAELISRVELLASLKAYDAQLGSMLRKNCGTGSGGFQAGNSCGRRSSAGTARRRRAAKRRRRGPGRKPNATQRQRRGAERHERLAWESRHPADSAEHREARRDLAAEIRQERADRRETAHAELRDAARTIHREREESRRDRRKDRREMARRQSREVSRLESAQARQLDRLDAQQARSRRTHEQLAAERTRIADNHRDALADLRSTHHDERADLIQQQRDDRAYERETHRSEIETFRNEAREARRDSHDEHRRRINDLRREHARERRNVGKSYKAVDGTPDAQSILDAALAATGHAEGWEAGTLTDADRREVLEGVVAEGRAWFRSEAEAMLGDLGVEGKALFGAAKARVGAFFARAKKHVRELFTAGVLAVVGPWPETQQDMIVQATQQQVAEQIEYLDRFERELVTEAKPINQAVASRAEMYADSVWAGAQTVQHDAKVAAGAGEVRRRLGRAEEHCDECPPLADLGWVKISDARRLKVVPLGRQKCMVRCRCWLEWR